MPRICRICSKEQDEGSFYIKDKKTNRLDSCCKTCRKVKDSARYIQNNSKIKEYKKQYYLENKESVDSNNKINRRLNKDAYYETKKLWCAENIEKVRGYRRKMKKKRKDSDNLYKLKENLRARYSIILKVKSFKKTSKFKEYLGCDLDFLKNHLESQFNETMNWENYGLKGWHIDHINPLDSASNEEELIKLLHYTNLQPLWCTDNYKKKNHICL